MTAYSEFTELVTTECARRDLYKVLLSSVLPRPIAFVSTISSNGVLNLAPFSFANAVCANPPAVMFAPANLGDGSAKDTVRNLREVGEFVFNVVPYELGEAMNETSHPFPPEVNEFEAAGLTPLPSRFIRPPRVAESPVQMECRLLQIVTIGEGPYAGNVCIGEVICFHVASGFMLPDGLVDAEKLDLIGRLGGSDYAATRERFSMPRPSGHSK